MAAQLPATIVDQAFGLAKHHYIFIIGGGGKTTLMYALAQHLASSGRTVVSTTSTRILWPTPAESARVIVEADPRAAAARLRSEVPAARHVTVARTSDDSRCKLGGYAAEELDSLRAARAADYLVVEADGAAGKSLKAYADYEPVVSAKADVVIGVIGSDCVGCPLDNAHVHRAELFGRLLDRPMGTPVMIEDVADVFFHPLGYLRAVPAQADVIVLISKAGEGARLADARRIAAVLRAADYSGRISRIVIGELARPRPFLEIAG